MATEGLPRSRVRHRRGTLHGWLVLAFVLATAAIAVPAFLQAIGEVPKYGGSVNSDVTVLTEVLPGGPAWRMGARVGDAIVSIDPGTGEETWVMETQRGTLAKSGMIAILRETVPLTVAAVLLAAAALLVLPWRPHVGAALAALAVVLTERTFMANGDVAWSTAGAGVALLLPGLWFVVFGPRNSPLRLLIGVMTAVVLGLWLLARFWDADLFETATCCSSRSS